MKKIDYKERAEFWKKAAEYNLDMANSIQRELDELREFMAKVALDRIDHETRVALATNKTPRRVMPNICFMQRA
jgi:hypothetical protein